MKTKFIKLMAWCAKNIFGSELITTPTPPNVQIPSYHVRSRQEALERRKQASARLKARLDAWRQELYDRDCEAMRGMTVDQKRAYWAKVQAASALGRGVINE